MVQLVQNFFNFTANTFFWLSYIPFYHRLFPVFDTNGNNSTFNNSSGKSNNTRDQYYKTFFTNYTTHRV